MIYKWAKILPYGFVMWLTKKFSPDILDGTNFMKDNLVGWRIDKGEWVVWNKDNYDRMNKKEREQRETKLDKKFQELIRKTSTNYDLNKKLREHYESEIENEKELGVD